MTLGLNESSDSSLDNSLESLDVAFISSVSSSDMVSLEARGARRRTRGDGERARRECADRWMGWVGATPPSDICLSSASDTCRSHTAQICQMMI